MPYIVVQLWVYGRGGREPYAALQFHAPILIIILFYFFKLIKKYYTAKKIFKQDKRTQQRTVRIGGVDSRIL